MKLLCIADHIDPLVYSQQIKERFADVSAVLSAGDLSFEYYDYVQSMLGKPLYFVFGNHNLRHLAYFRRHDPLLETPAEPPLSAGYVGGRVTTARLNGQPVIIAGLGGCMRYNRGENQYTEYGMLLRSLRLLPRLLYNRLRYGRYLDILLTHAPPRGIHDRADRCHTGFGVFLWLMRKLRPRYLVHGHVHLLGRGDLRCTRYHDTVVMNAYDHVVIDLGAEEVAARDGAVTGPRTRARQ